MPENIGTAVGTIDIDLSSLHTAVQQAGGAMQRLTGTIADAGGRIGGFFRGAFQYAVGGVIQQGLSSLAGAVGNLKAGLIDGNAEFERYGVQLKVLLGGSAEAAQQRLEELAEFGATTPFELPEVVRADKILQAFGLHATDAAKRFGKSGADIRRIAGDVAAGTGAGFEEIGTYIGKFSSGATGEAIARFQELGIVTKAELTKMGLSFDNGGSLIIKSQADLDKATGVLLTAMQGKYGGMMDAQSQTFEGMVSNLQDWKAQTLRTIGAPIFEVLKGKLKDLLAYLPTIQPKIEAFAQSLAGGLRTALDWLGNTGIPTVRAAFTKLQPILNWIRSTGLPTLEALGRYLFAVAEDGDYLNDWLMDLHPVLRPLVMTFGWLAEMIGDTLRAALNWLSTTGLPALSDAWARLQPFLDTAERTLSGRLRSAFQWLSFTGLPALRDAWKSLQPALDNLLSRLQPVIDAFREGGLSGAIAEALFQVGELRIQLVEQLGQILPGIIAQVQQWSLALLDWITTSGPEMLTRFGTQIGRLLDTIGGAVPGIVDALAKWGAALVDWVLEHGPDLIKDLWTLQGQVFAWIAERAPGIAKQLLKWAGEFIAWVIPVAGKLIVKLGELFGELLVWIAAHTPEMVEALSKWATEFATWFGTWATTEGIPAIGKGLLSIASGIWTYLKDKWDAAFDAGSIGAAIVDSIIAGVAANWDRLGTWLADGLKILIPGSDKLLGDSKPPAATYGPPLPPGRASGGPVSAGQSYMVGEQGPELIIPRQNGTVLPADVVRQLAAGSGRSAAGVTISGPLVQMGGVTVDSMARADALARMVGDQVRRVLNSQLDATILGGSA